MSTRATLIVASDRYTAACQHRATCFPQTSDEIWVAFEAANDAVVEAGRALEVAAVEHAKEHRFDERCLDIIQWQPGYALAAQALSRAPKTPYLTVN